ncbi:MAG: hypothetical protein ACKPGI_10795 [Verrucomicrobiota bacterium]
MQHPRPDFDAIWKEAFQEFFPECLERFYPRVATLVDWTKPVRFLDKELREMLGDSPRPRQFVDILSEVHLKDGSLGWILIHVEVQSTVDPEFSSRMLFYHVALFRRFKRPILSLAVLADPDPKWRPNRLETGIGDMGIRFMFPISKLSDFTDAELEADLNPVSFVILAERIARRHRKDPSARRVGKLALIRRLVRMLEARGYSAAKGLALTRVIEWLIPLPEAEEERLIEDMQQIEGGKPMEYLTSFERYARRKGVEEGRKEGLEQGLEQGRQDGLRDGWVEALRALASVRFPDWKPSWNRHLESLDSAERLQDWLKLAAASPSGAAFLEAIGKRPQ